VSEYTVRLPTPHAKQADFISSPAKRKVVSAGRRVGKTTGVALLAADKALEGRRVLEAAPTEDQTGAFWEQIKKFFAEPIQAKAIYKNETRRLLEFPNGGRIRAKTAWDADTLRGDYADLLILDEFSLMNSSVWDEVGAPMLLDNDGDAVFIFTPKRRNHAHKLYLRAQADTSGRWAFWHFTSYDNPHLSSAALEEIISDMTEEAFQQEILAVFLENEGVVFRNLAACMKAPLKNHPGAHDGHRIIASIDWGKQNDFTVSCIGCVDCRLELDRDRFNKIDYNYQQDRLMRFYEPWKPVYILGEANSIGEPNLDALRAAGLPVDGFDMTQKSKTPLIDNLVFCFEHEEFQFQNDELWTGELEAYERKVDAYGRSRFAGLEGVHDDTVIARALLVWAARNSPPLPIQPTNQSRWAVGDNSTIIESTGNKWTRY
jgi:hypothetical protein